MDINFYKNNKALIKASAFLEDIIGGNIRRLQLRRCIPIEMKMIED